MVKDEELKMAVREGYSRVAKSGSSCCQSGCCGSAKPQQISKKIGYTEEQMEAVPEGSNLGLGCGNPVALAGLKEGETVLDLGSGAGFDCFLASRAVGEKGKVIGVDMTEEMLERAAANARKGGYSNVEFRRGEIEALPIEDGSVDAVISNCVINLVPDKDKAFREAFRVLRPGGRLMVSDIVLRRSLPDFVKQSIQAYVGCLAGAVSKERYLDAIARAGFEEIDVIGESDFPLDCMVNDPTGQAILMSLEGSPEEIKKVEGSISSLKVSARKLGSYSGDNRSG
jgi:SAM-dependent methyltransferase